MSTKGKIPKYQRSFYKKGVTSRSNAVSCGSFEIWAHVDRFDGIYNVYVTAVYVNTLTSSGYMSEMCFKQLTFCTV